MDQKRWNEIIGITDEVLLEKDPVKRDTLILTLCRDNPELESEVRDYLEAIDGSEKLWRSMEASKNQLTDDLLQEVNEEDQLKRAEEFFESRMIGAEVGPYVIKSHIASGGMGDVFLASRKSADFHQNVALKLVRDSMLSKDQLRLFFRERKILSNLNHPNIARLLDGGLASDGRPYLVMEYVDGMPITDFCKENKCGTDQKLSLILQACKAVQYAHSNFIVHRDLKPQNLLVTSERELKVLDFGISKLLHDNQEGTDETLFQTGAHQRLLSLNYAAPEQLDHAPVTASTDVYGIGLLLYELLTERKAYDLQGKSPREIEQIIRFRNPPGPGSIGITIDSDLEAIVSKAIRKEPEERYGSVRELAEDILRYKKGHPVHARRSTALYRVRKFIKRNRALSVLTAVSVTIIAAFVILLIYQHQLTMQERDRALAEATRAEHLSGFLTGLFEANDPDVARGRNLTARELLDQGAYSIRSSFLDNHVQRGDMLMLLGNLYREIGEYEEAAPLLEEALELLQDPGGNDEQVRAMHALGTLRLMQSSYDEAIGLLLPAEEQLEKDGRVPGELHAGIHEQLVLTLFRMGNIHEAMERASEMAESARQKKGLQNEALFSYLVTLGTAQSLFPWELEQAQRNLNDAMLLYEMGGIPPASLMNAHIRLLNVVGRRGDMQQAIVHGREALKLAEEIYPPEHFRRAEALYHLAVAIYYTGNFQEAEEYLLSAMEITEQVDPEGRHYLVSAVHHYLGLTYRYAERFENAVPHFLKARNLIGRNYGESDFRFATITATTGDILIQTGRKSEGEAMLNQAMDLRRQLREENQNPVRAGSLDLFVVLAAEFLMQNNRNEEAIEILDEAISHLRQTQFDAPCWMLLVYPRKARALHLAGQYEQAGDVFREGAAMGEEAGANACFGIAHLYEWYADFANQHDPQNFPNIADKAYLTHLDIFGPEHPATVRMEKLADQGM